ncbi:hypothetical protein PybrP1_002915 [[Pythium] brassicae (nom. inval.)]|nr:hypothetical protein PybrP1_002915 [[Pythium] brassicae (nom. inval.)]
MDAARSSHHHHHHHRSAMPPSASADGPLSQERHMMERIREKLERAQLRLARQHAAQSATPGSSRYYPPNYESARARTPAPPVQSVKLEEFSLAQQATYASQAAPPSSSASGFLGVYPPQPHASSRRPPHAYASRRAPPTAAAASTRPSRQSVPAGDPTRHQQPPPPSRHQQQRYPPELQYKSASRNTTAHAPMSTAAPFLVYASAASPAQPLPAPASHRHHDRAKELPPSALRSAWQPPPSSRVRFQDDADADAAAEQAERERVQREKLARAAKAKERQKEKELALREMLHNERQKRDAAQQQQQQAAEVERPERTRRGSLPTPPKSEIDASAAPAFPLSPTGNRPRRNSLVGAVAVPPQSEIDASAVPQFPLSPSATRPRRNSLAGVVPPKSEIDASAAPAFPLSPSGGGGGRPRRNSLAGVVPPPKSEIDARMFQPLPSPRNRRSTAATAVPPASAIQASAFEDAPARRRSSAADELKHRATETPAADTPSTTQTQPAKRNASSDDDEFATPPTSPSSGGSSSSSSSSSCEPRAGATSAVVAAPLFDLVAAPPEARKHAPEERIPINVKPVTKDYDDALLLSNQSPAASSPSAKLKQLSIWEEDDEEELIASLNQRPSPRHQQQTPTPKGDRRPALIWDDGDEIDDSDAHQQQQPEEDPLSSQEPSPAKADALSSPAASNQTEGAVKAAAPADAPQPSQTRALSPARSPVGSRVPGSRPRPDLRSRISAALQAFSSPEAPPSPASPPTERLREPAAPPASSRPSAPVARAPVPHAPKAVASEPRASGPAPPSALAAVPRPPSTTVGRPSVTRPRAPLPPAPASSHPRAHLAPPSSRASTAAGAGMSQRRVRHREPLELKMQLPPQIGVLAGLSSGPITFPLSNAAFYEIEWRTGEFGFSFQRVYAEDERGVDGRGAMFLRMLLDTDRGTCRSFRDVRVGDILIKIGDVKVSDLGFDTARDPSAALTKYFTELRLQTPMRLVFQRMEVLDWEGGVEL